MKSSIEMQEECAAILQRYQFLFGLDLYRTSILVYGVLAAQAKSSGWFDLGMEYIAKKLKITEGNVGVQLRGLGKPQPKFSGLPLIRTGRVSNPSGKWKRNIFYVVPERELLGALREPQES